MNPNLAHFFYNLTVSMIQISVLIQYILFEIHKINQFRQAIAFYKYSHPLNALTNGFHTIL